MADERDKQRFKAGLAQQLRYIRNSCRLYDEGDKEEAIRAALAMRVMFHDTTDKRGRPRSVSLLTHLRAKERIPLRTSCRIPPPGTAMFRGMGRYHLYVSPDYSEVRHWVEPVLDFEAHPPELMSVQDWWEMPVYVHDGVPPVPSLYLRRTDIILAAANKEGGAHIDRKPNPDYELLASAGALDMYSRDVGLANGTTVRLPPLRDAPFIYLRQMAFEVLESAALRCLLSPYY